MNRREFLKGIGIVGAAVPAAAIPALIKERAIPQISFDNARLVRGFFNIWELTFDSPEIFDLRKVSGDEPKELVIEIGDYIFLLKGPRDITFSGPQDGVYHNTLSGCGWEQLT